MAAGIMSEAILILASVIIAGMISGIVIAKVGTFESAFTTSTESQKDRVLTKIKIVYGIDNSTNTANIWAKNVGINPITNVEKIDVYFGLSGALQQIPYNSGSTPQWTFDGGVPTNDVWEKMDTIQIFIENDSTLESNSTYMVQITTPNGITDEYVFST